MTMPVQFPALQQRGLAKFIKLALDFSANETLDPRITFSRTSNATRVNAQGLIEYAPHNLLTYSENFDNAVWVKSNATVTANAVTAPDGTTTADKLVEDTANSQHYTNTYTATIGVTYSISFYAKTGGRSKLLVSGFGLLGQGYNPLFDLEELTVSSAPSNATIQDVGNGWRRCSLTVTATGSSGLFIYLYTNSNSYTGDGTSGIYLWGAQLNIGSLQPYYTTSVKNLLGYSQNFENAAWTKSNSSVLTNLLTYSQEFDNAVWAKTNATVTANAIAAPDGTITGDTVLAVVTGGDTGVRYTTTQTSSTVYTASIYAKYTNTRYLVIRNLAIGAALGDQWTFFDLLNGTVGTKPASVTAVITPVGGGWYRCSVSATTLATIINNFLDYRLSTTDNAYSVLNTSTINIWGAQLVQGTNPEEYTVTTSAPAPIQVMGPLGFLGAEKLIEAATNSTHYIRQFPSITTPVAFSVYAKAGERTKFQLDCYDATNGTRNAVFNLVSGTVETILGTGVSANIIALSNGWYRCCMILPTSATGGDCKIALYTTSNSYLGDGTSGIYIFGAQLSDSASLDPYSYNFGAAPTSSAYYGPRFDYDPVTLAPKGLLIEEARTNLLTYSSEFDNAVWVKGVGLTVTPNTAISPDGLQNADTITPNGAGAISSIYYDNITVTASTSYTFSIYVKLGTLAASDYKIAVYNVTGSAFIAVDVTPTQEPNTTGWTRISYTFTTPVGCISARVYPYRSSATVNATMYFYGAQLEAGTFPTSYIPTTSAQVTRTADSASMVGTDFSSWYNQSEGTVAVGYDRLSNITASGYPRVYSINDGTLLNEIDLRQQSGSGEYFAIAYVGASQASIANIVVTAGNSIKTASSYATNNVNSATNTILGVNDNLATIPSVTRLDFGNRFDGLRPLNGHIQSIKYFNKRFLNTYLQSLTQ